MLNKFSMGNFIPVVRKRIRGMDLGMAIRRLRRERGWAIEDLVAHLDGAKGGDRASISKIETGLRWPRRELLLALARAFDLKVSELVELAETGSVPVKDVSPEERAWIASLRALSPSVRGHVLALVGELSQ